MRRQLLVFLFASSLAAAPAERSVSTSRQFVVYGGDIRLRGALCDLAETAKRNLLTLIGERDAWRIPIVVNAELPQANFPEAPVAHLQLTQSEAGLKLQLDLTLGRDLQAANVERELLRALLLEMEYRDADAPRAGSEFVEPPRWLIEGIVARERERDSASGVLRPIVTAGKAMPLDIFLQQRPETLDATSLQLYRSYSAALLDLVLCGADAPRRLGQFIRDFRHGSVDAIADLAAHFPQLNGMSGVAKVWKDQLTQFVRRDDYRLLSAAETARSLDEMLRIVVAGTASSLDDFPRLVRTKASQTALRHLREQLLVFEPRANPVYRGIVVEYEQLATLLARGSTKHVAERLARAKDAREQLATRMSAIDDYINWFEATHQTTSSGIFVDYMKAAETNDKVATHRRDPISVYLDAIESQVE